MKKKLLITLLFVMALSLILSACSGDKTVSALEVIEGLKTEYEINETPDFSNVKVRVTYNTGSTEEVGADKLTFSNLDTSIVGTKKLTVTFNGFKLDINVNVVGHAIGAPDTPNLVSIEYLSGLPERVYIDDVIDPTALTVVANYDDGSKSTISYSALKTDFAELSTEYAGYKTVNIEYNGCKTTVTIMVTAHNMVALEIDSDTIDTVVEAGEELDLSTVAVYAVYDNGSRVLVSLDDPYLEFDIPDLSVPGEKDLVIEYKNVSCTIKISTEPPTLERISLNADGIKNKILIGDTLSTAPITATAHYSNNTTKRIPNNELKFSYDVSEIGTSRVTATYIHDETMTAYFDVQVLGITSVSIDKNSVSTGLVVGSQLLTNKLTLIIVRADGVTVTRTVSDGVIVDATNVDTTKIGDTSYITASYGGVTSDPLTILVYDEDTNYYITGVSLPESLATLATKKNQFKNKTYGYVVGDDNYFYFTLILSAYTADGVKKENITRYTSVSSVYLADATEPLAGEELALYVAINESVNGFDFTEAAIGKTFRIVTRPRDGVDGYEADFTRALTVTVVDGYNIYKAYELNYMTNINDFPFNDAKVDPSETRGQVQIVDDFLRTEWNATRPASLAGIVLHNDLYIEPSDLPKEYFLDKNRSNELYDRVCIFAHATDDANPEFTIHGNYFTICSNALPCVVAEGTGNQDDTVSNGQLFGFMVMAPATEARSEFDRNYDHTKYATTVKNLYLRDNHPNTDKVQTAGRDMRGLIGMKTWYQMINLDNIKVEAFYISMLADSDYQTVTVNESIFYNSWQNHIFAWSENPFGNDKEAPIENHPVLTLTFTDSSITKCGGPVIIAQTDNPNYECNAKSGAIITLEGEGNEIWTYVNGTEAWFEALGVGGTVTEISLLNGFLKAACGGSYTATNPMPGLSGENFMNIIMINLASGLDVSAALKGTDDLDGKFIINGNAVLDMSDTYTATLTGHDNTVGYGDPNVATLIGAYSGVAPVFRSSAGGIGIFNGSQVVTALTGDKTMDAMNKAGLGMGDYVTLYRNNMGVVLGYNFD